MTIRTAVLLASLLLLLSGTQSAARCDEPEQYALEALRGTWTMLSFTLDGNEVEPSTLVTWQRIVKGTHVVWKDAEGTLVELDIKLDVTTKPLRLDSTVATGDEKGQVLLAIYELDDDELRVCFAGPGSPRPVEFAAPSGSGLGMYTCKRLSR